MPTLLPRHLLTGRLDRGPILHSLGMALSTLPPAFIGISTACGCRFGGRGVKGDPQSRRLTSGCAACWYGVAGRPLGNRGGWWMGGAIWGACSAQACLPKAAPGHPVPTAVHQYGGIVGDSWGTAASKGGMSKMESPGRGGTYPDIPPKEVLGVVTPPEEAVAPYPRAIPIN